MKRRIMNIEAGFVPARRDYAGPGAEPQKDEVNGTAPDAGPCRFSLGHSAVVCSLLDIRLYFTTGFGGQPSPSPHWMF